MIINLSNIIGLDRFLQIINKQSGKFVLKHNSFEVDAKSLLGIMSLDLTQNLTLESKEEVPQEIINGLIDELKEHNLLVE